MRAKESRSINLSVVIPARELPRHEGTTPSLRHEFKDILEEAAHIVSLFTRPNFRGLDCKVLLNARHNLNAKVCSLLRVPWLILLVLNEVSTGNIAWADHTLGVSDIKSIRIGTGHDGLVGYIRVKALVLLLQIRDVYSAFPNLNLLAKKVGPSVATAVIQVHIVKVDRIFDAKTLGKRIGRRVSKGGRVIIICNEGPCFGVAVLITCLMEVTLLCKFDLVRLLARSIPGAIAASANLGQFAVIDFATVFSKYGNRATRPILMISTCLAHSRPWPDGSELDINIDETFDDFSTEIRS